MAEACHKPQPLCHDLDISLSPPSKYDDKVYGLSLDVESVPHRDFRYQRDFH